MAPLQLPSRCTAEQIKTAGDFGLLRAPQISDMAANNKAPIFYMPFHTQCPWERAQSKSILEQTVPRVVGLLNEASLARLLGLVLAMVDSPEWLSEILSQQRCLDMQTSADYVRSTTD
jgi:hypothetical protein